jgi:hypothetical protein
VSTQPGRISRWPHLDLPHRIAALGVRVTHVSAEGERAVVAPPTPLRQSA